MLSVSEIFYSIQGEGKYVGKPSIFVRVGGCNFKCRGFGVKARKNGEDILGCDTIYAASWAYKDEWKVYARSLDLIADIKNTYKNFSSFAKGNVRTCPLGSLKEDLNLDSKDGLYLGGRYDLVLTGGEPSLYFQDRVLLETLEYFCDAHHKISIESNGSILFLFPSVLKKAHFTLSVKLSNAREHRAVCIEAIQNILDNAREVSFKFVVNKVMCESGAAIKEIQNILSQVHGDYDVYLMPQGISSRELDEIAPCLFSLCLERGYRFSDRLHIRLFGDKRGV